jgi:hypothetical protein
VTVEPWREGDEKIELEGVFLTGSAGAMGHAQQSWCTSVAVRPWAWL